MSAVLIDVVNADAWEHDIPERARKEAGNDCYGNHDDRANHNPSVMRSRWARMSELLDESELLDRTDEYIGLGKLRCTDDSSSVSLRASLVVVSFSLPQITSWRALLPTCANIVYAKGTHCLRDFP